jgi:hypothetical protein
MPRTRRTAYFGFRACWILNHDPLKLADIPEADAEHNSLRWQN